MIPTLSQVCSLSSPFDRDIADYAAGHCQSVEIWLTKLEAFVEARGLEAVEQLLDEHQVRTPVASYQGGLLASQGAARDEAWRLYERRLELCRRLQVGTLVVACDVPRPLDETVLRRVQMSLAQAAQQAAQYGMRLALEFQAGSAIGNNLQTAAVMVSEADQPNLGLCFDLFHFHVGPSKWTDLEYLTSENLYHVQLSDLADKPRELAADGDRILPGEGDIPLEPLMEHLRQIEYRGAVSIELMNPQIWRVPAVQFGEIAVTALRKLLGQATMG